MSANLRNYVLGRFDRQESLGSLSEDRDALGFTQPRSGENVIDRRLGPGKGIIRPQHNLARADLGGQVAQALRCAARTAASLASRSLRSATVRSGPCGTAS